MQSSLTNKMAKFGTMPVFMTAISTILGAILFLRFGYAVGHVGFVGVIGIILLGHMVTIPTALAVAEIATNHKVQGGGAYYIISRSFGLNIGAAIGITLYLSQAISVAFYVIAFGEAFEPLLNYISNEFNILITKKAVCIVTMILLSGLILFRGANLGMKALYIVIALVFTSLLMFFIGKSPIAPEQIDFDNRITNPDSFFYVFTIIFPAFTGLAAGLGLSGDLKNPKKSIPRGTIWATVVGILIYVFVAYKFTISASPEDLASDQLIMSKIAIWGPIIPIGLAAASISSALGSIMIAPRTLQAIGVDEISPNKTINKWLARGKLHSNEPVNATIISVIIAFFFVIIGDINFVARIISMFFMITYGSICTISFLEHFVADPSYRPTFKTKWYFSLLGAVFSLWLMFKMNLPYAIISILIISIIYYFVSTSGKESRGFVNLFRGVFFQLSKQIQVFLQQAAKEDDNLNWRPFMICISRDSFKRRSAFDIIRWISYKYGFGTYIHFIEGYLNNKTSNESKKILNRLINLASGARSKVYLDTIISPSYTSAIAQVIQLQSISGKGNNMILFEFSRTEPGKLNEALQNIGLLKTTEMDICILNSSYKSFGYKKEIHLWISSQDYENANLMILLAYILLGHPEWNKGIIKIFAIHKKAKLESQKEKIMSLIKSGRLPISPNNLILVPNDNIEKTKNIISEKSMDADLTIIGFRTESISKGIDLFTGYLDIGNILFVSSNKQKEIK